MSDDEENLCPFGTPLDPLEEDEIPSKKPIAIEDQIVTDSNGRRRFHGAFTGGFSAGFWNTVGSLEGWKPQSFKSSRSEKAKQLEQKPTDFMDDEDLGEFGIAPQRVQTTDDFTPQDLKESTSVASSRKHKLQQQSTGPIPGVPVLHQLLQPAKENVAIRLLKKMGWKVGQGIGARQTRKEKKAASERNARERYVMNKYGCDMGPLTDKKETEKNDLEDNGSSSNEEDEEEITFAPDDFDPYVCSIKNNTFGLGYSGLNPNPSNEKQHVNLFGAFEVIGKSSKKLSIRGQAFGVGALEEEDEDIYAPDDMTRYDFSLEEKKARKSKKQYQKDESCIDGFCVFKNELHKTKKVFTVQIPPGFMPRNWAVRKSRFEPLSEAKIQLLKQKDEHKTKGLGRHDLDPTQRGNILGETSKSIVVEKNKKKTLLEKVNEKYVEKVFESEKTKTNEDKSDSEVVIDEEVRKENEKIKAEAQKITKKVPSQPSIFKPFINNDAKQERYEKFLEFNSKDNDEITKFLSSIQPLSMSDWDREMEKKEFLQAKRIYQPLKGLMSDRFVSETAILADKEETKAEMKSGKKIEVKRTKTMWKPSAQLCKRFNIPEPFGGTMLEEKKPQKPRFSVFDYLEGSINTKDNFVTPVIIPTKIEKPLPIVSQNSEVNIISVAGDNTSTNRLTSKELFEKDISVLENKTVESTVNIDEKKSNRKHEETKTNKTEMKFQKPKTELEKKIQETKNKHPSEKKDIFKSIFENSSDEESDKEMNEQDEEKPEPETNSSVYSSLTKSATELNILRNTSPPRGIFANLFIRKSERKKLSELNEKKEETTGNGNTSQSTETESNTKRIMLDEGESTSAKNESTDDLSYGPKLPEQVQKPKIMSETENSSGYVCNTSTVAGSLNSSDSTDKKLLKLIKKMKNKRKVVEEWVEKTDTNEDKKKKRKKDKKKKSKKHKKEKKSRKSS